MQLLIKEQRREKPKYLMKHLQPVSTLVYLFLQLHYLLFETKEILTNVILPVSVV